jgi:oligopeptide/dipeptide ABC transporter ATP-binding protein
LENILEIENLKKHFAVRQGILKKTLLNRAVDGVTFSVRNDEMLALVGESGCGKSTLGKLILRLIEATSGKIRFDGQDITDMSQSDLRPIRKNIQVVFQDPYSSLNPRMRVLDIIGRGLEIHHLVDSRSDKEALVVEWLERVGLGSEHLDRYVHEFSGGQLQRIAIAKGLCVHPKFVILDEPTSALDVSIQAQICNLLRELKSSLSLTLLFISHNLAVVRYLSHRIAVMYLGKIVEMGSKDELFSFPKHPYTEALFSASLDLESHSKKRIILPGNVRSAIDLPKGCRFHPRCFRKISICEKDEPPLVSVGESEHYVACFNSP